MSPAHPALPSRTRGDARPGLNKGGKAPRGEQGVSSAATLQPPRAPRPPRRPGRRAELQTHLHWRVGPWARRRAARAAGTNDGDRALGARLRRLGAARGSKRSPGGPAPSLPAVGRPAPPPTRDPGRRAPAAALRRSPPVAASPALQPAALPPGGALRSQPSSNFPSTFTLASEPRGLPSSPESVFLVPFLWISRWPRVSLRARLR